MEPWDVTWGVLPVGFPVVPEMPDFETLCWKGSENRGTSLLSLLVCFSAPEVALDRFPCFKLPTLSTILDWPLQRKPPLFPLDPKCCSVGRSPMVTPDNSRKKSEV
uniref:Uncharacterized protein n=1 Tax=Opuntia streptacantha TaxID=393608 RepID=A0A7C9DNF3_OPUST